MPRYRVIDTSYINHAIRQPGDEVEIPLDDKGQAPIVASNLEPIDAPRAVVAEQISLA